MVTESTEFHQGTFSKCSPVKGNDSSFISELESLVLQIYVSIWTLVAPVFNFLKSECTDVADIMRRQPGISSAYV